MPRFVSPGAMGANAIEAFLVQRAQDERDRQDAELRRQQMEQQAQQQAAQLAFQRQQEARIAEAQRQAQANLEQEREFRRATTIVDNSMPADVTDQATADLLTRQGYGGAFTRGQPTQGAYLGEDEQSIPRYDVVPGVLQMRGGSKFLTAQAQREAQAAAAAANREAQTERTRMTTEAANERAQMMAAAQAGSRDIRDQIALDREARDQEKFTREKADRERELSDAKTQTQTAYDLATRLETHPGMGASTGAYELRTGITQGSRDFLSIRDQLVAALTQPKLGLLKGPMSDKDVIFVKSLATRLQTPGISEGEFRTALTEAKTFLEKKGAVGPTASGGGRKYYDSQGNPVQR